MPLGPHVIAPFLLSLRKVADAYYGLSLAYEFGVTRREWRNAFKSLRTILDSPTPAERHPRAYYRLARALQQARMTSPTRHVARAVFKAMAPPEKIVWVRPGDIACKTLHDLTLYCNDVLPGDWDRQVKALDTQIKNRSVIQHFCDGVPWRDTDVFKDQYRRMFESGARVRGMEDLSTLARHYESSVDSLYAGMREHGFRVACNEGGAMDIPHVHIGRDGRILFGNDGNHRLMIAKLLGVERIPCHVRARHLAWQQLRDRVATDGPDRCWEVVDRKLATHPDLRDLLGSNIEHPDVSLRDVADQIPSARGTPIRLLLQTLARSVPVSTAVVEVGSWLGAGTAQLALGLGDGPGGEEVRLHCYDPWRATLRDVRLAASRGVQLAVGEDLLPRVRRTLAPFDVPITFHQGDLVDEEWHGGPVSLYVDDTAATPELFIRALRTFGPSWVPGQTIIVLMDARFWRRTGDDRTFQKQVVDTHRRSFEPIESTDDAVFRYAAPLDFEALATDARIWALSGQIRASDKRIRQLKNSASWRVTAPLRRVVEPVRGLLGKRPSLR